MHQVEAQSQAAAVSNEALFAKLCEVEALLKAQSLNEHSKELWSIADVANYFKCSYDHAARCIVTDTRFPAPIDIKGRTGNKSKNYYIAGEVIRFCLQQRKKKARV